MTALDAIVGRCNEFDVSRKRSGIYLLLRGERIVYVGKSTNIELRLWNHAYESSKDFDRALWIPLPAHLHAIYEGALIRALKPEHNDTIPAHHDDHRRVLVEFQLEHLLDATTPFRKSGAPADVAVAHPALGPNIRARRLDLGMTQLAFAARCGVTQAVVSKWESGHTEPPVGRLEMLAGIFGCEVSDLVAAHTSTVATQNNSVISTVDSPLVDVRGQEG